MQNTKKYFSLIIPLTIFLNIFVTITSMDSVQDHRVNPYLSEENKQLLEKRIKNMEDTLEHNQMSPKDSAWLRKKLEHNKKIYYGNKAYTRKDIVKMDYQKTFRDRIQHALD